MECDIIFPNRIRKPKKWFTFMKKAENKPRFSPKEGMTSFQRTLSGFASLHRGEMYLFHTRL